LRGESFDEDGFLRNADQVRRKMGQLLTLRAFVERLKFFFGFVDDFEDGRLARSVEKRVERLKVLGQEILKARKLGSRRWKRRGGRRVGENDAGSCDGKRRKLAGLERSGRGAVGE